MGHFVSPASTDGVCHWPTDLGHSNNTLRTAADGLKKRLFSARTVNEVNVRSPNCKESRGYLDI